MQFNLIDKKWIPVKRRDGKEEMIAPWEVTYLFSSNPVVALNAPRPDFNGALIQFLIGLVQTVAAPANRVEWKVKLNKPPEPEELKTKFESVRHAFELGGEGPRFMQDFEKLEAEDGCIDGLLIEMPGDSTRKKIRIILLNAVQFSACAHPVVPRLFLPCRQMLLKGEEDTLHHYAVVARSQP